MSVGDYTRGPDFYSRQVSQVHDQIAYIFGGVSTNVADAYSATSAIPVVRHVDGMTVHWESNFTNTTIAPTFNLNAIGAKALVKSGGGALAIGAIVAGNIYIAQYHATSDKWRMVTIL